MRRREGSVRLGMVGLLMLVIAICLAVLGALALVTAHGDAVLSERHADSVDRAQRAEAAAQELLAETDDWLARMTIASGASSVNRSAATVTAAAGEALPAMVEAVLAVDATDASEGDDRGRLTIDAAVVAADGLPVLASERAAAAQDGTLCGIRAVITVEGTRTLTLVIAVRGDMTYDIVERTLTTEWADEPSALRLWEG